MSTITYIIVYDEFKSREVESDTLVFLLDAGPMASTVDGFAYMDGGNMLVGLPKKLFTWIKRRHCLEPYLKDNREYLIFVTDQKANKKEFYKCQEDSLRQYIAANPKYAKRYELDIKYLHKICK